MLVSKQAERVVYLDVQVDEDVIEKDQGIYATTVAEGVQEFMSKDGEDHLIIPIGMVDLDDVKDEVHCSTVGYERFSSAKRYTKNVNIDRNYELISYTHFAGDKPVTEQVNSNDNFYRKELFYNREQEVLYTD